MVHLTVKKSQVMKKNDDICREMTGNNDSKVIQTQKDAVSLICVF